MFRSLLLLILLAGCGPEKERGPRLYEGLGTFEFSQAFCQNHLGVQSWAIKSGTAVEVKCIDGSYIYLQNYWVDGIE